MAKAQPLAEFSILGGFCGRNEQGISGRPAGNCSRGAGAAPSNRAIAPPMVESTEPTAGISYDKAVVGCRRLTARSRWKRGQSGNPKGQRPKQVDPELGNTSLAGPADLKVGYSQPPCHTRWKKGQSGNPQGGRPRDILEEVLLSPFPIKIGAPTEMAPALDVMLLRIKAKALQGDQKVIRSLIENFGSQSSEMTSYVKATERPEEFASLRIMGGAVS